MTGMLKELERFVPELLKRRLALDPGRAPCHERDSFAAAVMFADISGFTPLANRLAEYGPEGAEELNRLLNAYFQPLVDLIYEHGGDVVRFVGDAMLAVWPAGDDLSRAVSRAAICGLTVQQRLHQFEVAPEIRLSLRISVAAGETTIISVGGVDDQWQLVLAGPPLDQIRATDKLAHVGDVVLSSTAARFVRGHASGEWLLDRHLRLAAWQGEPPPPCEPPCTLADEAAATLRAFVPRAVLARLDVGQSQYLSDLRHVHAMFIKLRPKQADSLLTDDALQRFTQTLEGVMLHYEGTLTQVVLDDKGTIGVACFGLPPYTHQDDALRACLAAHAVLAELAGDELEAGIGISGGRIFCGPLGSARRSEYLVAGAVVNLAARLMQQAAWGDVFCDEATATASRGGVSLQPLPRFCLKGIKEPVAVYRCSPAERRGERRTIFGRDSEMRLLWEALDASADDANRVLIIEGDAGIGKSAVLAALVSECADRALSPVTGEASGIEKSTPYLAWRGVFGALFTIDGIQWRSARSKAVVERLREDSLPIELAPLLNPLLDLDLPSNEKLDQLVCLTRAENCDRLLIDLLRKASERQHLVVVLDDAHWLDSASWRLARLAAERMPRGLLVLATRPLADAKAEELDEIKSLPRTTLIRLGLLAPEDTLRLVERHLGVERLSDDLAHHLVEHSQGNPFFAEELANHLRDAGKIVVDGGVCQLEKSSRDEVLASVPSRISALITSRIDQLPPAEQLTLKTASVIGRTFPFRVVEAVYGVPQDRPRLSGYLRSLNEQNLTRLDAHEPELIYAFRHITIQQVAYEQMPQAQRRPLHLAIAEWYETAAAEGPRPYPLLAFHWGRANLVDKEIDCLARSGAEALRANANREAIGFFEKCLARVDLATNLSDAAGQKRRAAWHRQLGEAHFRLSNWEQSHKHFSESLSLAGRSPAKGAVGAARRIGRHLTVQAWYRLRRPKARVSSKPIDHAEVHDETTESILACQRLSHIAYFTNDILGGTASAFEALNLAEGARSAQFLARSYADACIVFKLLRLRGLARTYARLAVRSGRQSANLLSLAQALVETAMFWLGVGRWDLVRRQGEEGVVLAERLGNERQLALAVTVVAMLDCFVGRYAASAVHFERVTDIGLASHNALFESWGLCGAGECYVRLGRIDEGVSRLEKAETLLSGRQDRTEEVRVHGLLAATHWSCARTQSALEHADAASRLISQSSITTASTLEGYAGAAEVYLANLEQARYSKERRGQASDACRQVAHYARLFPIGWPRAWRLQAWFHWLCDQPSRARACWARSLRHARRLDMEVELAMTCQDIIRFEACDSATAAEHARAARAICEKLGIEIVSAAVQPFAPSSFNTGVGQSV